MTQTTHTSDAVATPSSTNCSRAATLAAVVLGLLALILVSQGRAPMAARFASLVLVLFEQGVVVIAYLAAAAGWGYAVGRLVREPALDVAGFAGRVILGVGVMALLMWLLGWAGQLSTMTAWAVGTIGWALAGWQIYHERDRWWLKPAEQWPTLPWPVVFGVPAAALMVGAACIPPGVLWTSEAQGYDVLSYHLQLPKEWIEAGAVQGLTHNVYSYFPSLFEVVYAQLGLWGSGMIEASYTAQLLHVAMAILTAIVIGQIVAARVGSLAGAMVGSLYLAVPWTLVTGTLAYNEQAMAAFAAVALAVVLHRDEPADRPNAEDATAGGGLWRHARLGAVAGALVGLAVLTKLTAVGMVALPLVVLLAMGLRDERKAAIARLAGFGVAAGVLVGLFMLRNAAWTGNPVFPMLTGVFGTAHWTAEQAARWDAAHGSPGIWHGVKAMFSTQLGLLHVQFGYLVWPLAIAAGVLAWRHDPAKRGDEGDGREGWSIARLMVIVVGVQFAFWLLLTHHQSRFLVPLLVPICVLVGVSWPAWRRAAVACFVVGATVVVSTAIGFGLYLGAANGLAADYIDRLDQMRRYYEMPGLVTPYNMINANVPPDGRIYAEAFADPFYITRDVTYSTVWDTSEIGPALAEGPEAAHAWLVDRDYTHVVIAWHMLELWQREDNYGYDPRVDREALEALVDEGLRPVANVNTFVVYRVRPR